MSDDAAVTTSLAQDLRWATGTLAGAGIESSRWDAEQLAAHVLGVSKADLVRVAGLDAKEHSTFVDLVSRRAERVPLQQTNIDATVAASGTEFGHETLILKYAE